MAPSNSYWPLSQRESIEDSENLKKFSDGSSHHDNAKFSIRNPLRGLLIRWTPWILVVSLILSNYYTWAMSGPPLPHNAIFTVPAQSSIRYKNVVFTSGIDGDLSPYQGLPTPENNALWVELYDFAITKLSIDEAAQLTNRSTPISPGSQHYAVIISVFHQLHCLNNLRKFYFWNETEQGPREEEMDFNPKHMDHCIDSLRQTLMCSSDLSPIPYAWNTKYQQTLPVTGVTHTCRDFEALSKWAKQDERKVRHIADSHVHVADPLGNVEYTAPDSMHM